MTENSTPGVPTPKVENKSIDACFSDAVLMHFSKAETVINGFDEPEGVYLIKEGFIKVYSVSKDGSSNLLVIHEAGEFIPLPWALDGAHTIGLYYEAMTDVTVLRASKDKLRTAMGNNCWLTQEILKQAVNILAIYTNRIQTLEFRSAKDRVISGLLHYAERFGTTIDNKVIIRVPMTHQDIADAINMTRETASRALELLSNEGLVGQEEHLFTILNLSKLQAELE